MEQLQYDPRTKQLLKDNLIGFLYKPLREQLKLRLDTLIVKNTLLGSYKHKSFVYKGEFYSCDSDLPPRKANRVVQQLIPVMDEYLREIKQLNEEELPYTLGYINQVLNASNDLQDYLRLLPAALHRPIEELSYMCPCRSRHITEEQAKELEKKNELPINLIKQRMVRNLLI
jgi:hypothetical protein